MKKINWSSTDTCEKIICLYIASAIIFAISILIFKNPHNWLTLLSFVLVLVSMTYIVLAMMGKINPNWKVED